MKLYGGTAVFTLGAIYACVGMTRKKKVELKILVLLERQIVHNGRAISKEMGKDSKVRRAENWEHLLLWHKKEKGEFMSKKKKKEILKW